MKKFIPLILCLLMAFPAVGLCQISVTRRDLALNQALDKSVNNTLVMMLDEGKVDTLMIASINSRTGRSVMTRVDCALEVTVEGAGNTPLSDVYMLGEEKSRGLLVCKTLNELLSLNIGTYVALDIARLPELAAAVGTLNMQLDAEEAKALGTWEGINEMSGDAVLNYVRMKLHSDSPARSRGYDALMQLLYQGLHSGNIMDMFGLGSKLLASMDTNLNPMTAMTLVGAVQAGADRRELLLPQAEHTLTQSPLTADAEGMQGTLYEQVYE